MVDENLLTAPLYVGNRCARQPDSRGKRVLSDSRVRLTSRFGDAGSDLSIETFKLVQCLPRVTGDDGLRLRHQRPSVNVANCLLCKQK